MCQYDAINVIMLTSLLLFSISVAHKTVKWQKITFLLILFPYSMSISLKLKLNVFRESLIPADLVAQCECFISTGSECKWNNLQAVVAISKPPAASELTSHNLLIGFLISSSRQHNPLDMTAENAAAHVRGVGRFSADRSTVTQYLEVKEMMGFISSLQAELCSVALLCDGGQACPHASVQKFRASQLHFSSRSGK